jgi:hypothetical protein
VEAPRSAARLWPHYDLTVESAPPAFLFARLLEDGESGELRWLFASRGERAARDWLTRRGGRALSRRSLAFWALVLDVPPQASATHDLWPLA